MTKIEIATLLLAGLNANPNINQSDVLERAMQQTIELVNAFTQTPTTPPKKVKILAFKARQPDKD